jgi:hypothetical protein
VDAHVAAIGDPVGDRQREPGLADPAGPGDRHEPGSLVETGDDLGHLGIATDQRGQRSRHLRAHGRPNVGRRPAGRHLACDLEPLAQQHGQVPGHEVRELLPRAEPLVGAATLVTDGGEERGQARLALGRRLLEVEQPRPVAGEAVLVLQPRQRLAGRDPAVALPVDPEEDLALFQVGPVQLAGRVRPGTELEQDGHEAQLLDRGAHDGALLRRARPASS